MVAFSLLTMINVLENDGRSTLTVLALLSLVTYVIGEILLQTLFEPKDKKYTRTIGIISCFISFTVVVVSAKVMGFL